MKDVRAALERRDGRLVLDGLPVPVELERYVLEEERRLHELVDQAVPRNTRRAYTADWDSFVAWCLDRGVSALPASPDTVARYIRWMIDRPVDVVVDTYRVGERTISRRRGRGPAKTSTVRRHLLSIGIAHRLKELEDPTKGVYVRTVAKGIRRERGTAIAQKAAFERDHLVAALARRPLERLIDYRDVALILLAWTGAFRRSELVDVDVEDLLEDAHGLEVLLRRSKTNQDGKHESVLIPRAGNAELSAIDAIASWRTCAGIESGPLFRPVDRHGKVRQTRLSPKAVAAITKNFAALVGLDPETIGAHSLRSGWITSAAAAGRAERDMMRHSRHKNLQVFRGYVRNATKWQDHAGIGLL